MKTVDCSIMTATPHNIWSQDDGGGSGRSMTRIPGYRRARILVLYAGLVLLAGFGLLQIALPRLDINSNMTGISTIFKKDRVITATTTPVPEPFNQTHYISKKDRSTTRVTSSTEASNNREYNCTLPSGEEVSLPRIPQFIVAGTMKGGTTALGSVLKQHPSLERSRLFEAHFFDSHNSLLSKIDKNESALTESDICEMRHVYATECFRLNRLQPESLAFEKTPAYMALPHVPQRIQVVAPWAKIIITLRNPVERAFSHFKMEIDRGMKTNLTFGEFFAKDLEKLRRMECVPSPARVGMAIDEAAAENNHTYYHSSCSHKPASAYYRNIVYRGFYAQQLQNWIRQGYRLGEDLLVFHYEWFKQEPIAVMDEIMEFVGVPRHNYTADHFTADHSPVKKRFTLTLEPEARQLVQNFYAPYNEQLADLLGEEWRGIWH